MDKADIANDYIERRTEQTLKARQYRPSELSSRAICKQCDEPIPAARRQALPGFSFVWGVRLCWRGGDVSYKSAGIYSSGSAASLARCHRGSAGERCRFQPPGADLQSAQCLRHAA